MYVGKEKIAKVKVTCIDYDEEHFQEKEVETIEECFPFKDKPTATWINLDGIHQLDNIEKIGKHFKIHPLVLEDIMNTGQRPKMEDFGNYLFMALKMLRYDEDENETKTEQVSLILSSNYVISFQESEGDVFDPIRDRIRSDRGRIRKMGVDYLAYSLIDAIVDNYFMVLEKIGEKIEDIEDELVKNPTPEVLHTIHRLKRELIFLRKSVWPLREVISRLERWESPLIDKSIDIYLRDVYDHTIQVIDALETFRDMLSGMLDIYLSSVSNRMNEVMKVLTIIATIFIPLTLVAGIYGMNFKYMPELDWFWGYPMVYMIMLAIGVVMLIYFRRKKWL
ncbi:MAG: magnesium/cobalt transporter CorA [Candidatus Bathyarchaeota archaeon]|jgi:magnesium transporter|nr:magnesium/cobalt transporter CorA [Candidatus Bathyarchaeota archaeon]